MAVFGLKGFFYGVASLLGLKKYKLSDMDEIARISHPYYLNEVRGGEGRMEVGKLIQAVEQISRGAAVHPRAGDLSFPEFFLQRCTQCKRCTEECPFGALDEDEKGTPQPNPNRCRSY